MTSKYSKRPPYTKCRDTTTIDIFTTSLHKIEGTLKYSTHHILRVAFILLLLLWSNVDRHHFLAVDYHTSSKGTSDDGWFDNLTRCGA